MADISKITLNGTDYNVKDANAVTSGDVATQISAATSGLAESSAVTQEISTALSSYTPTSGFTTINGSAITSGGNITISGGGDTEEVELVAAAGIGDTRMRLLAELRNNHFTKEDIYRILKSYATESDLASYVQTSVLTDLLSAVYNLIEESELVTAAALNDLKIMIQ